MDFFKMYDEVKEFESNYKKEQGNKEISTTGETDRNEEIDTTEEKEEETNNKRNLNLETENKIESEDI